jgi:hypothetical protein
MNPTDIPRAPAYVSPTFTFTGTFTTEYLKSKGHFVTDEELSRWLDANDSLLRTEIEKFAKGALVRVMTATKTINLNG